MITRAQLDAALSDLEKKLEREIDLKVAASGADIQTRLRDVKFTQDVRRERAEEDIFIEIQGSLERANQACVDNARSIKDIDERLRRLEDKLGAGSSGEGSDIEDDFSS